MGSMTDEEYNRQFLELLRYVPYLKEKKVKAQGFISGFLVAFKYMFEFDEPRLLEETIQKLKNYYEKSKNRYETKRDWKGN